MIRQSNYYLFLQILSHLSVTIFLCTGAIYGADYDGRLSAYEKDLLHCINQYRAAKGLKTLSINKTLQRLAISHSQYMDRKKSLNHDHFNERFEKCGRTHCIENCGWNYITPEDQLKAWINSREHNTNVVNKDIKFAGISKVGAYVTFFACD